MLSRLPPEPTFTVDRHPALQPCSLAYRTHSHVFTSAIHRRQIAANRSIKFPTVSPYSMITQSGRSRYRPHHCRRSGERSATPTPHFQTHHHSASSFNQCAVILLAFECRPRPRFLFIGLGAILFHFSIPECALQSSKSISAMPICKLSSLSVKLVSCAAADTAESWSIFSKITLHTKCL